MSDTIPDDMTELYDAEVPRIDLVGKGANGLPLLIAKQQDEPGGLFEPGYVRDLIAKSDRPRAASHTQEVVTVSGSPAALAEVMQRIHGAPVRKAEPEPAPEPGEVEKAALSGAELNDLPDSAFAYIEPGGKKDADGKTTPRDLRHFAIHDKAHADNAAARIAQGAKFGDKAKAKVEAAQRKFGEDVTKETAVADGAVAKDMDDAPMDEEDSLDPCTVLVAPEDDAAPGDPSDPGSPAWETIDAATARKWTAIAARLRSALGVMADRESLEAATVDPDDAEAAMDLDDAACAVDYAISVLASFAVDEQAEADDAVMAMVGKSIGALDTAHLDTVELLGAVRKAGRALSSANEKALRSAITALQQILASLPKAPDASAPMQKEQTTMGETVDSALTDRHPLGTPKEPAAAEAPAVVPGPGAVAKADETPAAEVAKTAAADEAPAEPDAGQPVAKAEDGNAPAETAATEPVAKADTETPAEVAKAKTPQVAIYDQHGNLVGTVDPGEITMLAPAKAPDADPAPAPAEQAPDEPAKDNFAEAPAATPTDLTPMPSADAGTPADAVNKSTDTAEAPQAPAQTEYVLKSSLADLIKAALTTHSATQEQALAKQAQDIAQLAGVNKALEERNAALEERLTKSTTGLEQRMTALENAPAVMAIASNGALPPAHLLRGQNHGATTPDAPTAALLKAQFRNADDAVEQKKTAQAMTVMALEKFAAMQQDARR